jgi:uncharacterized membrane protein
MFGLPLIRPALLTCAVYLLLVVVIDIAISLLASWKDDTLFVISSLKGYVLFGLIWLVSFVISMRIEFWLVRHLSSSPS